MLASTVMWHLKETFCILWVLFICRAPFCTGLTFGASTWMAPTYSRPTWKTRTSRFLFLYHVPFCCGALLTVILLLKGRHTTRSQLRGANLWALQFHVHTMSEHQISNNAYGMELHMVHANAAGELAVVGVFIDTSSNSSSHENAFLKTIWPGLATPAARAAGGASQTLTVNPAKHNGESVVIKAIKLLISICIPVYAVSIYVIFYVSI